jgi:hypothetical protein
MTDQVFDFLRVQALRQGSVAGYIGEQHRNIFAFAGGLVSFIRRLLTGFQCQPAFTAESVAQEDGAPAAGAVQAKFSPADPAKFLGFLNGALAVGAIHGLVFQGSVWGNEGGKPHLPLLIGGISMRGLTSRPPLGWKENTDAHLLNHRYHNLSIKVCLLSLSASEGLH